MIEYKLIQKVKVIDTDNLNDTLLDIMNNSNYKRPMFVFDKFIESLDVVQSVINNFAKYNIDVNSFNEIVPDPPVSLINKGVEKFKSSNCDSLIAIGGGSTIDVARGINIVRTNGGSILDYEIEKDNIKECPGLIAVPTTSGTGSEMSNALVLTDTESKKKIAILANYALSEYSVLYPQLTLGLPQNMTIATGLDAFSHAAEGYLSKLSSPVTDAICEKIMFLLYNYLPVVVKDGHNLNARRKVMVASTLAGWMLNNAGTNIGHSAAHILGSKYHIVHGEAVAYGLPGVFDLVETELPEKICEIGQILGVTYLENESVDEKISSAKKAYKKFRDETIGLHSFSDYKISKKELETNVNAIVNERFASNTPVNLNNSNVKMFLEEYGKQ